MSLDYFLCHCLQADKTTHSENGRGVSIDRQKGETVLFFLPDEKDIREQTRKYFKTQNFCDVVVYYKNSESCSVMFFVELKGTDVDHAVKQLEAAITSVTRQAPILKNNVTFKALIVSTSSSPSGLAPIQKRFQAQYKTSLRQKTIQRGVESLRNYLN